MRELLEQGKGVKEIARLLGLNPSTVSYHRTKLGYPPLRKCATRYDWAAVQAYYDQGRSKQECHAHFGFSHTAWADAVMRGDLVPRPHPMPFDELLAANTPRNRNHVKLRLLAGGLKQNRCEDCGIARWHRRPLALCLHHVNGDRHDNRLENLRLLCPNCHSQTPNFGSKNRRRRPE